MEVQGRGIREREREEGGKGRRGGEGRGGGEWRQRDGRRGKYRHHRRNSQLGVPEYDIYLSQR